MPLTQGKYELIMKTARLQSRREVKMRKISGMATIVAVLKLTTSSFSLAQNVPSSEPSRDLRAGLEHSSPDAGRVAVPSSTDGKPELQPTMEQKVDALM